MIVIHAMLLKTLSSEYLHIILNGMYYHCLASEHNLLFKKNHLAPHFEPKDVVSL